MHRYQLIMFDMDGTFIDSRSFHEKVFYRFFNERVMPVTKERVAEGIGNTVRDIFQSLNLDEKVFPELFQELEVFCRTRIDELIKEIYVAEDTLKTLVTLEGYGVKTAVVTNSMQCVADRILKLHGLEKHFSVVSGADITSLNKNQRCEAVRKELGAEKEKVLYVGDAESDIVLAGSMGYDSCFADTPLSWGRDKAYIAFVLKPTYTVGRLYELIRIIQ